MNNSLRKNQSPIFIVGAPRSGTTLLSAMLSNHDLLCCGPETQFFNKVDYEKLELIFRLPNWQQQAAEYLCSITLSGQSVVSLFGETKQTIEHYLMDCSPSITSLLESLCEQYTAKNKKSIWVEKTPNHILHLELIRKLYPTSRIIRIMRDPRDSAHSMIDLPWTSDCYVENCYLWKLWFDKSKSFFEKDQNSITVRFEDLLTDPVLTLSTICQFLKIDMQESMLDTRKTGMQVSSSAEYWKKQVSAPLDKKRTSRWKDKLSKPEITFSDMFFDEALVGFKYPILKADKYYLNYYPDNGSHTLIDNQEKIIDYAGQGIILAAVSSSPLTDKELVLLEVSGERAFFGKLKLLSFCFIRKIKKLTTYYDGGYIGFPLNLLTKRLLHEY